MTSTVKYYIAYDEPYIFRETSQARATGMRAMQVRLSYHVFFFRLLQPRY